MAPVLTNGTSRAKEGFARRGVGAALPSVTNTGAGLRDAPARAFFNIAGEVVLPQRHHTVGGRGGPQDVLPEAQEVTQEFLPVDCGHACICGHGRFFGGDQ